MAPRRSPCSITSDLFSGAVDFTPTIKRFDDHKIRAASLSGRVARMVTTTLKECGRSREEIAEKMGEFLGKPLSPNMLNAWSSESREDHVINLVNLIALIHVTGDVRLLQAIAEMFGHQVITDKYLPWIEVGQLAETRDEVNKAFEVAKRNAKRGIK